jgi:hypothetical protein
MKAMMTALIALIVAKFAQLNGTSLVGIREYEAKGSGEVCNHVVNANFSYGEAKKKDMATLAAATKADLLAIAKKAKVAFEIVETAIAEMQTTSKKRSEAQKDAFIPITNAIKLCKESGLLHIYAMAIWKSEPIVTGTFKEVNSRPKTIAKNVAKKYFNLSTAKYRSFIIHPDMISEVAINGDVIGLK